MGFQDFAPNTLENKQVNQGSVADYKNKQLQETTSMPSWRAVDLTQFIAQPIQDVFDTVSDAIDTMIAALEFISELVEIVGALIVGPLDVLLALIETIKSLVNELFDLLDLGDAGVYALYIPFQVGGSDYYVNTFLDSLKDTRDTNRPQMGNGNFTGAMFLKTGVPTFDFDLDKALSNLASKYFGLQTSILGLGPKPHPLDFTVKTLYTPIEKVEGTTNSKSADAASIKSPFASDLGQSTFNSLKEYASSEKVVDAAPKLNANLRWKTPTRWELTMSHCGNDTHVGKVEDLGNGRGRRTDVYEYIENTIDSIYIVRTTKNGDMNNTGIIKDLCTSLSESGVVGSSLEDTSSSIKVTRLKAYPFRNFYYDDTLEEPTYDSTTRTYAYTSYWYRIAYGYKQKLRKREEVWVGDLVEWAGSSDSIRAMENSKLKYVNELKVDGTGMQKAPRLLRTTKVDALLPINYYGREIVDVQETIGELTRVCMVQNDAITSDIGGTPPDWASFHVIGDLFPSIKEFMDELRNLINNILDSVASTVQAIKDAIEKIVREIQDLIDAAEDILRMFKQLMFPPIAGLYACAFTTYNGIPGTQRKFLGSLNLEEPPTNSTFGAQYLKEDSDGSLNATSKEIRYDIVPYYPANHYCGGFVFMFGSIAGYELFKQLFSAEHWEATWDVAAAGGSQMGWNNIKVPELIIPESARSRRRREMLDSPSYKASSYTGDDNSATQFESDVSRGLIVPEDNEIDLYNNGTFVSENGEPFINLESSAWPFLANGIPCSALLSRGDIGAEQIVAAINSAYQLSTKQADTVAKSMSGKVVFNTPPGGFGLDDLSFTFGYSDFNNVLGVTSGHTLFGKRESDFATHNTQAFAYKPGDLLCEVTGEGGNTPLENICTEAVYVGSLAFNDSDTQNLGGDSHKLHISIDSHDEVIDVTGNSGSNLKKSGATYVGGSISEPYVITDSTNKFYMEVVGFAVGKYPSGPILVELLSTVYNDTKTLISRLQLSLHEAGFTLGLFDITDVGGNLSIKFKYESSYGSSKGFRFTGHMDNALPLLGITPGVLVKGTDLVKYDAATIRDNINNHFGNVDSAYSTVCSVDASGVFTIRGQVKGSLGKITIVSMYRLAGDPPEVTGDLESSLVSETIFGTDSTRGYDVEVSGIGTVGAGVNYDLELYGEGVDVLLSENTWDKLEVEDSFVEYENEVNLVEYLVEVL